jgi:hypothetical protein
VEGSLGLQLDEQRKRSAARRTPEMNEQLARGLARIRELAIPERALAVGDPAPAFVLPDARGRGVRLGDLLARGPVVLAFYRGVW